MTGAVTCVSVLVVYMVLRVKIVASAVSVPRWKMQVVWAC